MLKGGSFALSHFELNRYFGDGERWGPIEIENRARELFRIALQLWPRPAISADLSGATEKSVPAAFHGDCVKLAQKHLGAAFQSCLKPNMKPAMVGFD